MVISTVIKEASVNYIDVVYLEWKLRMLTVANCYLTRVFISVKSHEIQT